ncbi:unnamed protein product [Didymodactylos carnosus]|uniref:Uncharacterized protein n=1 Tax=Didymodactylos carnosus TaxID=1234261 RepID=A0A815CXE3_9BILA|nr:unnamed protein product [Didymodactylos carnosus]CAF4086322.1 unnamed protein product [Didymodactylos carnosus]
MLTELNDSLPKQHGRRYYNSSEEDHRRQIFSQSVAHVLNVNSQNLSYKLELNHLSDLTEQEFNKQKKGYIPHPKNYTRKRRSGAEKQLQIDVTPSQEDVTPWQEDVTPWQEDVTPWQEDITPWQEDVTPGQEDVTIPTSLDWVAEGRVSSVKDQLQCGDCYAFATTAVMEGLVAKKTGLLLNLSPQEINDCSLESELRFFGPGLTQDCRDSSVPRQIIGPNISYTHVNENDEAALLQAVLRGPVFVSINANVAAFMYYTSGIINLSAQDCDPNQLDHAVTLVGYGFDDVLQLNYWKVKNSWGTSWGEDGYVRIARGTNVCGIAADAVEADTVEADTVEADTVKVDIVKIGGR